MPEPSRAVTGHSVAPPINFAYHSKNRRSYLAAMPTRFVFIFCAALFFLLSQPGLVRAQDAPPTDAPAPGAAVPKPVGHVITLSDFGAEDLAYLSVPATPPMLGIVLVPDAYGLDDFTKSEADRLAGLGYLVLAVDIYNGHQMTDPGEMANLTANMETPTVMKTVEAGIRVFHESPKFRVGHVVAMGWGTGAKYVFQAARQDKTLDGAIMFYGPIETNVEKIGKFSAPVCAVYSDTDPQATRANVQVFERMMKDSGNDFEAWFIAAGSGWSNPASRTYNPVEDKEAWKVAMPFLVRIGAEPVKPKDDSIIDKAKDKIKNIFNHL
jgi:carboxymethylenebutenolidase